MRGITLMGIAAPLLQQVIIEGKRADMIYAPHNRRTTPFILSKLSSSA